MGLNTKNGFISKSLAALAGGFLALFVVIGYGTTISVPHTFSAGQTALASEVNENFSTIVSEIRNISGRLAGVESSVRVLPEFTTAFIDLPTGSTVVVGTETYEIRSGEIVDPVTGRHYSVKYPVPTVQGVPAVFIDYYFGAPNNNLGFITFATTEVSGIRVDLNRNIQMYHDASNVTGKIEIAADILLPEGAPYGFWLRANVTSYPRNSDGAHDVYVETANHAKELLRYIKIVAI